MLSKTLILWYDYYMKKIDQGFTIVELLIVIVVIAILAAITFVGYTGIQNRSKNASIVAAANQSLKLINGYLATNETYPI